MIINMKFKYETTFYYLWSFEEISVVYCVSRMQFFWLLSYFEKGLAKKQPYKNWLFFGIFQNYMIVIVKTDWDTSYTTSLSSGLKHSMPELL